MQSAAEFELKRVHLVRLHDSQTESTPDNRSSKMVSEIYLTWLLSTKVCSFLCCRPSLASLRNNSFVQFD